MFVRCAHTKSYLDNNSFIIQMYVLKPAYDVKIIKVNYYPTDSTITKISLPYLLLFEM